MVRRVSDDLVKQDDRIGVLDAAGQFVFVVGPEGRDLGDVAQDAPLGLQVVADEVGQDYVIRLAHAVNP